MSTAALMSAGALAVALLSGCIAPAVNHGAFEQNAKSALESASSETATAQLALHAFLVDNASSVYTDTVVTDDETAMGAIQSSFGVVDPPSPAQDRLRDEVLTLLSDAGDALGHARIAVRRGDPAAIRDAGTELAEATKHLQSAREKLT